MKVNATYQHLFEVTREVEIDDEDFTSWREREEERGRPYDTDDEAIIAFLNAMDTEFHAATFLDFRVDEPLPKDFELQWSEVTEAERSEA